MLLKPRSILCIAFFLSLIVNCSISLGDYSVFKDKIELLSWLFAGIISLLSFFTLFIAFSYDNKLLVASKNLDIIVKPYGFTIADIRQAFYTYEKSLIQDKTINLLYWVYIYVATSSIFIWGLVVELYTDFGILNIGEFNINTIVNMCLVIFWISLVLLLLYIGNSIYRVYMKINPVDDSIMPKSNDLCNLDYLIKLGLDIDEFF
ncbi:MULTISPECIES: hypothetical protein [unclassified Bacillus (in: firmicutes)]|uniref:hypothetical protein n=1 Tax=unclassified Bacillus (in: firmicutes) TaxID=185979 RepID=UPI001BEB6B99|nr:MULTISPECIES: hypothetical protein [unclassified Bacillus (in: firmicutes)]MBT2616137.1 hypothetical protein [Bacillus sp. ISL-78]MBT2628413.1 hypothetical protein [Bacillus sp. ISL-101]